MPESQETDRDAGSNGFESDALARADLIQVADEAAALKSRLEKQLDLKQREIARQSLAPFLEYTLRDPKGQKIKLAPVHQSWCDHINEFMPTEFYTGILAPWGYGKSTIISIGLPLFLIGKNPNLRIGIICNSDPNACKRVGAIGENIRSNADYRKIFPHVKPGKDKAWNDHRLTVDRTIICPEGTVEAYGIDSSGIASRFDIMIFDDPIDQKDAESEAVRKSRIEKFNNVWSSRIEPGGQCFYIATRWHKHDLTHEVMQRETWKFIVQAVSDDFECIVEPPPEYRDYISVCRAKEPRTLEHWHEKWSKEELKVNASRLGIRAFNRGKRQRPYSAEDTLFNYDSVVGSLKWALTREDAIPPEWPRYLGADLSSDKRPGTCIIVIARDPKTGKKKLVEIRRGNWGWSTRTANTIVDLFDKHGCRLGFVENNVAQETMLELIRTLHGKDIPLRGYTTGKQKADPLEGLPGLAVEFENDAWEFPLKHVVGEKPYMASSEVDEMVLIRELLEYPQGANSDTVMALWFASAAAKFGRGAGMPGVYGGSGNGRMFAGRQQVFGNSYGKGSRTFESQKVM